MATPWLDVGMSRTTFYRRRAQDNPVAATPKQIARRIAMLSAEIVYRDAKIAGLTAERNRMERESIDLRHKLVEMKWP